MLILNTLRGIPDFVDHIIVIDDGSIDSSLKLIKEQAAIDVRIVPIVHEKNMGVGQSIIDGYKMSIEMNCDIAAVMAGDDQMDPKYLPSLLDPIVEYKADYTKGNRLGDGDHIKGMSFWRYTGNEVLTLMTKFSSGYWNIGDPQNGYTAISIDVFKKFKPDTIFPWYGYCNDILMRLKVYGFRVSDLPIPARYGMERSKIQYPKYIARISRLLLVNFILRLAMKKAIQSPHLPSGTSVVGSVMLVGGLVGIFMHPVNFTSQGAELAYYEMIILIISLLGLVCIVYGAIIKWTSNKIKGHCQ